LIVMSLPLGDAIAERLLDGNLTTVLVELDRPGFSAVTIDDLEGSELVADYLVRRGQTCFAYLGEGGTKPHLHDQILQSERRLLGFRAALEQHDQKLEDTHVRLVRHNLTEATAAAGELLDLRDRPTAVFAHDDVLASGVLRAARQRSLTVPDEVAVVGFDDSELAEHLDLTSVRQPFEESGKLAAEILLSQLRDGDRSLQRVALKLELIERSTT